MKSLSLILTLLIMSVGCRSHSGSNPSRTSPSDHGDSDHGDGSDHDGSDHGGSDHGGSDHDGPSIPAPLKPGKPDLQGASTDGLNNRAGGEGQAGGASSASSHARVDGTTPPLHTASATGQRNKAPGKVGDVPPTGADSTGSVDGTTPPLHTASATGQRSNASGNVGDMPGTGDDGEESASSDSDESIPEPSTPLDPDGNPAEGTNNEDDSDNIPDPSAKGAPPPVPGEKKKGFQTRDGRSREKTKQRMEANAAAAEKAQEDLAKAMAQIQAYLDTKPYAKLSPTEDQSFMADLAGRANWEGKIPGILNVEQAEALIYGTKERPDFPVTPLPEYFNALRTNMTEMILSIAHIQRRITELAEGGIRVWRQGLKREEAASFQGLLSQTIAVYKKVLDAAEAQRSVLSFSRDEEGFAEGSEDYNNSIRMRANMYMMNYHVTPKLFEAMAELFLFEVSNKPLFDALYEIDTKKMALSKSKRIKDMNDFAPFGNRVQAVRAYYDGLKAILSKVRSETAHQKKYHRIFDSIKKFDKEVLSAAADIK